MTLETPLLDNLLAEEDPDVADTIRDIYQHFDVTELEAFNLSKAIRLGLPLEGLRLRERKSRRPGRKTRKGKARNRKPRRARPRRGV